MQRGEALERTPRRRSYFEACETSTASGSAPGGSVDQGGEGLPDGSGAVSEGGDLGAAIGRGMEHDRDQEAGVAYEPKTARPDLLVDVKAVGAHARHDLSLRGGETVGTGCREVAVLIERRDSRPEEPASPHDGLPRRVWWKVGYESFEVAPRRGSVGAAKPFVELINRQAADRTLVSQPTRYGIPLKVTRAKLAIDHRGRI
jgi:hypothetical protein